MIDGEAIVAIPDIELNGHQAHRSRITLLLTDLNLAPVSESGVMTSQEPGIAGSQESRYCNEYSLLPRGARQRVLRPWSIARTSRSHSIYDAFISYRHVERDRKWAEWLIDALERYRVPKALQDKGLPQRLRKVFRDEDEVPASADLTDQIRQALAASRFLIVVCSAFTPRSRWVCREIEIFNELGRGDHVLALLTEGEPGDLFPAPMLARWRFEVGADGSQQIVKEPKEPLAADVRPRHGVSMHETRRLALLRLVAVILGVKFDDLRQRDHARVHRRHLIWMSAAAAVLLLFAGCGLAARDMMRPTIASFRQLAWRWGLPEGVGPIDAETRAHIDAGYSITSRRNGLLQPRRVVEVRLETSSGTLRANEDGQARWVVHYSDSGAADRVAVFDASDRLVHDDVLHRVSLDTMIVKFERNAVPVTLASRQVLNNVFDPKGGSREGRPRSHSIKSPSTRTGARSSAATRIIEVRTGETPRTASASVSPIRLRA